MKYYGAVGYSDTYEDPDRPGIWKSGIVEKNYKGDIISNYRKLSGPEKVNDDISVLNKISIISDPYADTHYHAIKYATYCGAKWKVADVEVRYPRLILTLGALYND